MGQQTTDLRSDGEDIIEADSESCYVPLLAFLVRIAASISVSLRYINRRSESKCHTPCQQNGTDSQVSARLPTVALNLQ